MADLVDGRQVGSWSRRVGDTPVPVEYLPSNKKKIFSDLLDFCREGMHTSENA